jgi:succinyl-diaminopimelate desuccinylase
MTAVDSAIQNFVREHAEAETRFLAEIVKVPSDNPPGDCARSTEVVAKLLEGLGFQVERHKVPESLVKANGMISATNLIARRRFGQGGPTVALNAHGDVVPPGTGWTRDTPRRRAFRSCFTARVRTRSRKPTPTAPTRGCRCRICTKPPK